MPKVSMLFIFVFVAESAMASNLCPGFFASSSLEEKYDGTDDLIAYLGTLLEEGIIGEEEMRRFVQGLEAGELVNPISEEQGRAKTAALLHRQEIKEYLDQTIIDPPRILSWAKKYLREKAREKAQREETRVVTENLHQRMNFFPIPPGKFEMGRRGETVSVELTHTIEMMSTLVTQKHWVELMGENPSYNQGPDHPVERVSWWSAIVFANKLSQMHGLKPAYDLQGIEFEGRAEDGTLRSPQGRLKINAPNQNTYLTEGYRLPTNAEQEYVRKNLGRANELFYFGNDYEQLIYHAWYRDNSEAKTHPVAELEPLTIKGNNFFDLYGNVEEWGQQRYSVYILIGGINPTDSLWGPSCVVRGGGYKDMETSCLSSTRLSRTEAPYPDVGFRLVRTIK